VLEKEPPPGIEARSLLEIPLVLVARRSSKIKSVEELIERRKITEPLICMPADEPVTKIFRTGLADAGVDWHTTLEVNSFDLAEKLAAKGFGIAVSVVSPSSRRVPGVSAIPLPGFPTLKLGVLWQGKLEGLLKTFVEGIEWHVGNLKQMLDDEAQAISKTA
jgi:DNA-binding transcriptional LysR family regulator